MIKRVHMAKDGHRFNLDSVPVMTRTLTAGSLGGRDVRFAELRHGVAVLRETKAKSGQYEHVHTLPWAAIDQLDHEGEFESADGKRLDAIADLLKNKK